MQGINEISYRIIGAAINVHRAVGPGLLESTYQSCLAHELRKKGLRVAQQVAVPVVYDGLRLDCGYRVDMIVEGVIVLELKAVAKVDRVFLAQLLTYLRHTDCRLGLLLNFNEEIMVNGVHRVINGSPQHSPGSDGSETSALGSVRRVR